MNVQDKIQTMFMGLLTQARYILRSEKKYKPIVERYPDKISGRGPEDLPTSYKGYLKNDLDKCSGCGVCVPVCPVGALALDKKRDSTGGDHVQSFRIDLGRCFSCNVCVDECPDESLSFTREFEMAMEKKDSLVLEFTASQGKADKLTVRMRTYEVRR